MILCRNYPRTPEQVICIGDYPLTCWTEKVADHIFKLEMCPQYTDAPAVGYLTIKLQNSTWYKCLNLSLTGSRTYVCTHIRTEGHTFVRMYTCTHVPKTEKLYAPGIIRCGGIKIFSPENRV